jgi:BlaI family transcriptional regulator, penicillinase repressor
MRKKSETLTPQELEIMKAIWASGPATVRDVYEDLRERRDIAYTTVQTMMNLLETKGHLSRTPGERAAVYAPTQPKQKVIRSMVAEFVERLFDGSAKPLLAHLVKDGSFSDKERRVLQRIVDEADK